MKNTKKKNIVSEEFIIKHGYMDVFYSFKLCNEKKYTKTISKINSNKLIISENIYNEVLDRQEVRFTKDFEELLLKRKNEYKEYLYKHMQNTFGKDRIEFDNYIMRLKINKEEFGQASNEAAATLDSSINVFNNYINEDLKKDFDVLMDTSAGLRLTFTDLLDTTQVKAMEVMVEMNNLDAIIMGKQTNKYKMQWLLQPLKIKIFNNIEFINVYLNLYANGNAVLRLSIPIRDVDFRLFHNDTWCDSIQEVFLPQIIVNEGGDNEYIKSRNKLGLHEIAKLYMNFLKKSISKDEVKNYDIFSNMTLIDYSLRPETFDGASNELKELIFGILFCPFNSLTVQDAKVYKEMWENNYFSMNKYLRYYFSTNCRSIAIHSSGINTVTYNGINLTNDSFYFSAIQGISQCIENMLLKKYNYDEYQIIQLNDEISLKELRNLKKEMLHNENLTYMIFYRAYGTVGELSKFMENKVSVFMPIDNIIERGKRIEELINLRESEIKDKFNIIIGFITVLLTIILSLPSIESITKSIDTYMVSRVKGYTQIAKYSVPIWLIINFCILLTITFVFRGNIYRSIKRKFK
ncbi:hypothetical protein [Clostridium cochlearium]|uniref:hypothetical protein n=1 Tax=Clostridium cochlearium TaxID=1494 RepID=UPI000BBBD07A|nr:hypothetical protein [Clostridium cochlearium]